LSAYEYIKSLPEELFKKMARNGCFCSTIERDIDIYEFFIADVIKTGSKMISYQRTADKFGLSYQSIIIIAKKFE
jgi:hypothetical protein